MMREEETVRTASGDDVQVDAGADRYFVDERNRTWVGAPEDADAVADEPAEALAA